MKSWKTSCTVGRKSNQCIEAVITDKRNKLVGMNLKFWLGRMAENSPLRRFGRSVRNTRDDFHCTVVLPTLSQAHHEARKTLGLVAHGARELASPRLLEACRWLLAVGGRQKVESKVESASADLPLVALSRAVETTPANSC